MGYDFKGAECEYLCDRIGLVGSDRGGACWSWNMDAAEEKRKVNRGRVGGWLRTDAASPYGQFCGKVGLL